MSGAFAPICCHGVHNDAFTFAFILVISNRVHTGRVRLLHCELNVNIWVGPRKAATSFLPYPVALVIFNEKTFVRLSCFLAWFR
jgi:hypothetical protein